jgi:methyl halide transferase
MTEKDILKAIDRTWTLFLDRDGVLNQRIPDDYVRRWEDWHWKPGVLEALKAFSGWFGEIVVVTNQRGIARGLYTEADLADIHAHMIAEVQAAGGRIDAVYHCPHDKDAGCDCRKPQPGMLLKAAAEHAGVHLEKALLVGDSLSDLQAAHAVGMPSIFVGEMRDDLPPSTVMVVADLPTLAAMMRKRWNVEDESVLSQSYWDERWQKGETGWDIGQASPALVAYLSQVKDKNVRILIPGAGSGYEADWLWANGFRNVTICDWSPKALDGIQQRIPDFPKENLVAGDFFELEREFDLIMEQTFFCALPVSLRHAYAIKMFSLLAQGGTLAGLMFDFPLESGPPFGGSVKEYQELFRGLFDIKTMERCYNSIKPREGRELFVILKKLNAA